MARDDYYVIVYKLLSYLYSCLKKSIPVDVVNLREIIKVDIKDEYWKYIIYELSSEGYIDGVTAYKTIGMKDQEIKIGDIKIKPKGIEYLQENKSFKRAVEFLKSIKEVLPWL